MDSILHVTIAGAASLRCFNPTRATVCWCVSLLALHICTVAALDTIFAKGGTCMYKISKQYQQCMDQQEARLRNEKERSAPVYTREALTDSLNKISCCAYWEFLQCVEEAAAEFCPKERHDMRAYVRQLGSAVPVEDCIEQYPSHSPHCVLSAAITTNSPGTMATMTSWLLIPLLVNFINHLS